MLTIIMNHVETKKKTKKESKSQKKQIVLLLQSCVQLKAIYRLEFQLTAQAKNFQLPSQRLVHRPLSRQ